MVALALMWRTTVAVPSGKRTARTVGSPEALKT